MSIYSYLKEDHKKIKSLLNRIEEEGPEESDTRTDLFNELKERLIGHEKAEEISFYEPLKESHFLDEDEIEDMEDDHEESEDLLYMLTDPELVGEDWYDVFLELKAEIESHIEQEEDELFDKARQALSTNDAQDMEAEMKRQKKHIRENEDIRKRGNV